MLVLCQNANVKGHPELGFCDELMRSDGSPDCRTAPRMQLYRRLLLRSLELESKVLEADVEIEEILNRTPSELSYNLVLERLVATLGDAGNQEFQVFVECDASLESQVVGKFTRRAAENLVDFGIHLQNFALELE